MSEYGSRYLPKDPLVRREMQLAPIKRRLVEDQTEAWSKFTGTEIKVPNPPDSLVKTLLLTETLGAPHLGFKFFKPHYLPNIELEAKVKYPGWHTKPTFGDFYWTNYRQAKEAENSFSQYYELDNSWVLLDETPRPDHAYFDNVGEVDGIQRALSYRKGFDPIGEMVAKLQSEGKINRTDKYQGPTLDPIDFSEEELRPILEIKKRDQEERNRNPKAAYLRDLYDQHVYGDIPPNSRYGVSWKEIHDHVLPELAEFFDLDSKQVRLLKGIEFNMLGNMYHPEWGQDSTEEWIEDNNGLDGFLSAVHKGGFVGTGGLGSLRRGRYSFNKDTSTWFRPVLVFPT